MPLIEHLQRIKEHLAFQRLCLVHSPDKFKNCLSRKAMQWELGKIALIESEIVILQHRLSFTCSMMRGCLNEWDDLDARKEMQQAILKLLAAIKFNRSTFGGIASVFVQRRQGTFDELLQHRFVIEKYLGFTFNHEKPDVSGLDIAKSFLRVLNTDVLNFDSIRNAVYELGRDEAHYWKMSTTFNHSPGPNLYHDRMN